MNSDQLFWMDLIMILYKIKNITITKHLGNIEFEL